MFKNGKSRAYLTFSTGKNIVLNDKETKEFESKVDYWVYAKDVTPPDHN